MTQGAVAVVGLENGIEGRALVPEDPFERLRVVRIHMRETLSRSAGSRQLVGTEGEFWSPRKMLRRAVWHESDHTQHIDQLRTALAC
jgi:hypothetical protein